MIHLLFLPTGFPWWKTIFRLSSIVISYNLSSHWCLIRAWRRKWVEMKHKPPAHYFLLLLTCETPLEPRWRNEIAEELKQEAFRSSSNIKEGVCVSERDRVSNTFYSNSFQLWWDKRTDLRLSKQFALLLFLLLHTQNVLMLKCVIKSFKREFLEQNDTAHTVNPESNQWGVINYFHVYH